MTAGTAGAKISLKAIIFLVISVTGFIFYGLYDKQVFPAASIDIKLSQHDASEKSRKMAASLGYDVDNAKTSTTFTDDDDAKTVLEFKLGIDKANQLMKSDVPVWLWHTRFCKELSKDEFLVTWTTQGKFKSFYHIFENDKKLPTIAQDEALSLARQFITETAGMDLTGYDVFERGSEKQPNRTDHHFIWRKPGYKESEFRIRADVAGNQVSTCRWWLAPTDTWTREYKSIRQWNELLGNTASLFLIGFIAATIGAFIYGVVKHSLHWRFALYSGGVVATLVLLESINNFAYSLESYNTSSTYLEFLLQTAVSWVLSCIGSFLATVLMAGGGEVIYRLTSPAHTTMQNLFSPRGMAQRDYARKTVMGYLLVGVMMFWAISYYKFGQSVGYFCPLGVDDYKVLGNMCPAISGALIGVTAAGLEELSCRVVALGLLQKVTKNFWLANIIQAVVWGFAHSTYPQEPCYARGVELTVVGLLFGYIVRRYGLLPCLVAHYLYDAFLTVQPVFLSQKPEYIVPSLLILVPSFAAIAYSRTKTRGDKVDSLNLTNGAETPPERPQEEIHHNEAPPAYTPLSAIKRRQLLMITAVCAGLALIPGKAPLGKDKQVTVNAHQATALAQKYATEDGIDIKDYQSAAELVAYPSSAGDNNLTWQYIYEKLGYDKTKDLYKKANFPGLEWYVRFFKPLESKIGLVYLNGDGSKRCSQLEDIDEAPGANLDEAAQLAIVQDYIKKNRPELEPIELETQARTAQPKRFDYSFNFRVPHLDVADTPAKLHVETRGDKISKLHLDWKLPDKWSWPRKQQHWYQQICSWGRIAFFVLAALAGLAWGVHLLRSTRVPWRLVLACGIAWCITVTIGVLNASVKSLMQYETADAFENFVWQTVAGKSTGVLLANVGCFVVSMLGIAALKKNFPQIRQQLHTWILLKPENEEQKVVRTNLWTDAAISSYAMCAVFVALQSLQSLAQSYFSPEVPLDVPTRLASIFSTSISAFDTFSLVTGVMIGAPLACALFASLWQRFLNSKIRTNSLILACAILWGLDSWYWQNCLIDFVFTWYKVFLSVYFIRKIFAGNALAYVFAAGETVAVLLLADMLGHVAKIAVLDIAFLSAVIAAPAILAAIFWWLDRRVSVKATPGESLRQS